MAAQRAIKMLALVGLVVGAPGFALAQGRSGVGVVTTLVGEATVTRAAIARDQTLKMRDDVFGQDRISTRERSLVHVLLGGKALLTVRELSVVTVREEDGRATVDLQSGKVGLAVVRERMKPGEAIEVHTPHAVAAVRGTVLVVEIVPGSAGGDQSGAGGSTTNVHLLHGKLDVSLRNNPAGAPVQLESLQTVSVSRDALGKMRPLSPAAADAATAGLRTHQPTRSALPEGFQSALGDKQRLLAVETAESASGSGAARGAVKGQGLNVRAMAGGKAMDVGSARGTLEAIADTGDGIGPVSGSASGPGSGGNGNGNGRGNGPATGLVGGAQPVGPGSGVLGTALSTAPQPVLQKKGK